MSWSSYRVTQKPLPAGESGDVSGQRFPTQLQSMMSFTDMHYLLTIWGGGYTQDGVPASIGAHSLNVADRHGPPVTVSEGTVKFSGFYVHKRVEEPILGCRHGSIGKVFVLLKDLSLIPRTHIKAKGKQAWWNALVVSVLGAGDRWIPDH